MTRWPFDPLTFSKKNPSRANGRSTYIQPPSLAKIRQRTSEEIGNKQTNKRCSNYSMILTLKMKKKNHCESVTIRTIQKPPWTSEAAILIHCAKKTIHQATTILATSKNYLFPGHNPLANQWYWWPNTLIITWEPVRATVRVKSHKYRWLAGGYNLEIGHS